MNKIFRWFYCLPISEAVALISLSTIVYLFLRNRFERGKTWRSVIALLLLSWLIVIAFGTIVDRTPDTISIQTQLIPFYSYYIVFTGDESELLRTNFMNVVLFYPAGLFACELLPKNWSRAKKVIFVAVLFALVSVGIEFCQYHFALGQAEIDDVIHNMLGALIGSLVCTIHIKWKPCKSKD